MPHEQIRTWDRKAGVRGSLTPLRGSKYAMIDAHLHVVNFTQETPGGEALLYAMDQANVGKAVIFGLPFSRFCSSAFGIGAATGTRLSVLSTRPPGKTNLPGWNTTLS